MHWEELGSRDEHVGGTASAVLAQAAGGWFRLPRPAFPAPRGAGNAVSLYIRQAVLYRPAGFSLASALHYAERFWFAAADGKFGTVPLPPHPPLASS